MPPWLPAARRSGLRRRARAAAIADISIIRRWAAAGAPEGNPAERPQPRSWPAGWELGQPDLVVTMPRAYTLAPGPSTPLGRVATSTGTSILPLNVPATKFVRAVEFRTEGAPVHHAVIRVDRGRASAARDGLDGQPGFDGHAGGRRAGSRRALHRLGARPRPDRRARRPAVVARRVDRPRGRTAPAAGKNARRRAAAGRLVLHRDAAGGHARR